MKPIVTAHSKLKPLVLLALCVPAAIALPAQTLTTIHTFCSKAAPCPDGVGPNALVQGIDGSFYGTTAGGGADIYSTAGGFLGGAMFKITSGKLTTIYNFCSLPGCADGGAPYGALVEAKNSGDLYGVTTGGGANPGPYGIGTGTIYKITLTGSLTTLYNFCSETDCADGYQPYAGLVQATNGDYYGTTGYGGAHGGGTLFKITAGGTFSRLYSFCSRSGCADGGSPYGALVQGNDGNLYGTTTYGGDSPYLSTLPSAGPFGKPGGTVFKFTPQGKLTTLYSFCSEVSQNRCTDGEGPAVLIKGIDGNLYGTTSIGGANTGGATSLDPTAFQSGDGTIYRITPSGEFKTLYNFCSQSSLKANARMDKPQTLSEEG